MARKKPTCGIYVIVSPTGKIYVGQSRNAIKRFQSYLGTTDKVNGQPKLANSFKKHGTRNHTFTVIEECDFDQLNKRERYWQDYYDACSRENLNCTLTRTDELPTTISEETRKKMSENAKVRMERMVKNPEYMQKMKDNGIKRRGVKLRPKTDEEKEVIRQNSLRTARRGADNYRFENGMFGEDNGMFGKHHSDSAKAKIGAVHRGRVASPEARAKMSAKRTRGKNCHAKIVLNMESGIFYECGKDAWEAIGYGAYTTLRCKLNGSNPNNTSYKYV